MDTRNGYGELRAETSTCDCGTVSPPIITSHPILEDSELVEWEASHLQWFCPIPSHGEFDDHLDIWQHAALPNFTREPAELAASIDTPTWHQPLKADIANRLVATHTQEPT
ncbi:hypothetical protein [Amycolatopsis palatopharyngis]|uniref:hypothetical protein n=1 Tax=Amycolatopsis palatopharyngis TaxID=187982 RepID=UPI000E22A2EB|nr:hypothetical protein [Amycolatopsis palatopharyngis]